MIILRNSMIFAICSMLIEYVVSAVVFSKPLRLPIQKILYATRFPRIIGGAPSKGSTKWLAANREMLRRSNITIFHGNGAINSLETYVIHKGAFENKVDLKTDEREATWTTKP